MRNAGILHGCVALVLMARYSASTEQVTAKPDAMMLLQTQAKKVSGPSAASSVPLSEDGYKSIALLKDDGEMKTFIRRVISDLKLNANIEAEAQLSGLVPYYSGNAAVQTFARLRDELHQVKWLTKLVQALTSSPKKSEAVKQVVSNVKGSTAALTEDGYRATAALKNDIEMKDFMRRLLSSAGLAAPAASAQQKEDVETWLSNMVPHYSGTKRTQTFARMFEELIVTPWANKGKSKPSKEHVSLLAWPAWMTSSSSSATESQKPSSSEVSPVAAVPDSETKAEGNDAAQSDDVTEVKTVQHLAEEGSLAESPKDSHVAHTEDPHATSPEDTHSKQVVHVGHTASKHSRKTSRHTATHPSAAIDDSTTKAELREETVAPLEDHSAHDDAIVHAESASVHSKAYGTLAASLADLRHRLTEQKASHEEKARAARSDYEAQLHEEKAQLTVAVKEEKELSATIERLNADELDLRAKADALTKRKESLDTDLSSIEATLGTAVEFAVQSIAHGKELNEVSSLEVLSELDEQEELERSTDAHKHRLDEVQDGAGQKKMSLIEISSSTPQGASSRPDALLKEMDSSLNMYDEEAASSENTLKEAFLAELHVVETHLETVVDKSKTLKAEKASLQDRNARLQGAVTFLEKTCKKLDERIHSLREYAGQLGAKKA